MRLLLVSSSSSSSSPRLLVSSSPRLPLLSSSPPRLLLSSSPPPPRLLLSSSPRLPLRLLSSSPPRPLLRFLSSSPPPPRLLVSSSSPPPLPLLVSSSSPPPPRLLVSSSSVAGTSAITLHPRVHIKVRDRQHKARSALPVRYHFHNYGTRGRMGARRVVPVRVCASRASGDGGGERNGSGRAAAFQKSIRVTFIPENGFGRAGVDSEPERGGPPSVGNLATYSLGSLSAQASSSTLSAADAPIGRPFETLMSFSPSSRRHS